MCHISSHPIDRGFTDPVRVVLTILFSGRRCKLNNQARLLLDQHRGAITTRDVVGADPNLEHGVPKRWRELPERGVETALFTSLFRLIAAPGVIDEKIM